MRENRREFLAEKNHTRKSKSVGESYWGIGGIILGKLAAIQSIDKLTGAKNITNGVRVRELPTIVH